MSDELGSENWNGILWSIRAVVDDPQWTGEPNKVQDKTHCQSKYVHLIRLTSTMNLFHRWSVNLFMDQMHLQTKITNKMKTFPIYVLRAPKQWPRCISETIFYVLFLSFLRFPLIEFQTSRWLCAVEDVPDNVNNRLAGEKQKEQRNRPSKSLLRMEFILQPPKKCYYELFTMASEHCHMKQQPLQWRSARMALACCMCV